MHGLGRCVEVYDYISVYMYSCTATAWAREHLPYRGVRPGRWGRHSVVLVVVVVVVVMIMLMMILIMIMKMIVMITLLPFFFIFCKTSSKTFAKRSIQPGSECM